MQKCLNKEAKHYNSQFKKYPILWVIMFLLFALSATVLSLAIMCNTSYSCSYLQQDTMLWFGLMMSVSLVLFVVIPNILRFFLNYLYEEEPKAYSVKKMSPLSSPSRSRPKYPLKSVRHTMAA